MFEPPKTTVFILTDQEGKPLWITVQHENPSPRLCPAPAGGFKRQFHSMFALEQDAYAAAYALCKEIGTRSQGSGPLYNPIKWDEAGNTYIPQLLNVQGEVSAGITPATQWHTHGEVQTRPSNVFPLSAAVEARLQALDADSNAAAQAKVSRRAARQRLARAQAQQRAVEFYEQQAHSVAPQHAPVAQQQVVPDVATWRAARAAEHTSRPTATTAAKPVSIPMDLATWRANRPKAGGRPRKLQQLATN